MSNPYPIFGEENLKDDDGAVIDSFFIEVDNAPKLDAAAEPITIPAVVEPTEPTRLITGYNVFQVGDRPILVVPADPYRICLEMRVISQFATPTFNDCVYIADDQSKLGYLTGAASSARPLVNSHALQQDGHTGAVFAAPGPNIQGPIMLMWTATTK